MYWKNGFYDTPVEGGVEITNEYWQDLLEGQSRGLAIVEDDNGHPILREHVVTLEDVRRAKMAEIAAHDTSTAVNSFCVNGVDMWLDKQTRSSIAIMLAAEQTAGGESTTFWTTGKPLVGVALPISFARQMVAQVEVYAKKVYDVTQQHRAAVCNLADVDAVAAYDHTAGYPPKLTFTTL